MQAPLPYRIHEAGPADLPAWSQYQRRELADNGRDGVYFTTVWQCDVEARFAPERLAAAEVALRRSLEEPDWLRVFVATDAEGGVVGHADLRGGSSRSELHRCEVGLGVDAAHRRRGLGEALMRTAIAWARERGLAWIDLGVFDGNARALALYHKLGFTEVAKVRDAFRVDGAPVTDIAMTLQLT